MLSLRGPADLVRGRLEGALARHGASGITVCQVLTQAALGIGLRGQGKDTKRGLGLERFRHRSSLVPQVLPGRQRCAHRHARSAGG